MTWETASLAELAAIQGGIQKQPKRAPRANRYPFLRVGNVTAEGLDLREVHEVELFGDELDKLRLQPGDLLVVEGNGSPSQVGRAAVWNGSIKDCVHQNHLIRVRPGERLLPRFLGLVWNSPAVRDELSAVSSSTSGLHTLSVAKLKRIRLPVPPVSEQWRIVEILEDHISRLDAANQQLARVGKRLDVAEAASLELAVQPRQHWQEDSVVRLTRGAREDIIIGPFGSNLMTKDYSAEGVPLIFVRNVRSGNFLDGRRFVAPSKADELASHVALDGDVLVTKMGDPPGDTAVYRGDPAIITADLIRLRPSPSVDPDFAAMLLASRKVRRQILDITSGVAQKKVSLGRFRSSVRVAFPTLEEQTERAAAHHARLASQRRLREATGTALHRSTALRRGLLAAAFSGRLTGRHADDEIIEEMAQ